MILLKDLRKPLGKWGNCKYKSKHDFKTYKDYLEYMYGKINGFIARCAFTPAGEFSQTLLRPDKLVSGNEYAGIPEVYTSMNSFMTGKSRKIDNIKRLNALFIDIDYYKLELSKEQVIYYLENKLFDKTIPRPTFIIHSGRGIYLQWKLYKTEDRNALPRWKRVQSYLFDQLRSTGADPQALDAARILRTPYSFNSNSGSEVEILEFDDVQYTLYEIIKEYDIYGYSGNTNKHNLHKKQRWGEATQRQIECATEISEEQDLTLPNFASFDETFEFIGNNAERRFKSDRSATENQIKYATKIAEQKGLELPDFNDFKATYDFIAANRNKPHNNGNDTEQACPGQSYLVKWLEDIKKLITSRKGKDCCRELCLFLCRLFSCETTHDYEEALKQTLDLNSTLDEPFPERYVRSRTQSAETIIKHGETYKYKKESIIELLKITDDEMKQLNYLNNKTTKEREQTKNRKAYEKHLQETDKKTKTEEIKTRRANMAEMINNGKKETEIREKLKISRSTYYIDKASIIAEGLVKHTINSLREFDDKAKEVKRTANKITDSIAAVLKEAAENMNEFVGNYIKSTDSNHDIQKNNEKNSKINTDKQAVQKIHPYYCIWTT